MHPGPYNPPPPGAYPPYGPYYGHPGAGSRRGDCSCSKVYCCCCCCCLFIIVALIVGAGVALFFIITSNVPKFYIDGFESKSFGFSDDGSLKSQLQATVKAENPTKYLEFVFGEAKDPKDNSFEIFYSNLKISSGTLPIFTLSKKNTTTIKMDLNGEVKKDSFAEGSDKSLADKLKNNDNVPLLVVAKVPINKFKISGTDILQGMQFVVNVNTTMNVKNLAQGKNLDISDKKTDIAVVIDKSTYKLINGKIDFF